MFHRLAAAGAGYGSVAPAAPSRQSPCGTAAQTLTGRNFVAWFEKRLRWPKTGSLELRPASTNRAPRPVRSRSIPNVFLAMLLFSPVSECQPYLEFQAAIIGALGKPLSIGRHIGLVRETEQGRRDVADDRPRIGVIEQISAGHPNDQVEAPLGR